MPRKARIDAPGALHHVIVRGIERRTIYKDSVDKIDFIQRMETVISETVTQCFGIPGEFQGHHT